MEIQVYADWLELKGPKLMGILSVSHTRGNTVFTFAYDKAWLDAKFAQNLDPSLQYYSGPQYLEKGKKNFGVFMDSSPDRWGRVLMDRREALMAKKEGRNISPLYEEDYLLGVHDHHRMGALRFKHSPDGPFLDDNSKLASPPWTSLRELEQASLSLESDNVQNDQILKWINLLIAPGASLGGARPKASVTDRDGNLWIAKFPSANDKTDIGAWEMVVNILAAKSGINIAEGKTLKFNNQYHTFLSKRFDRTNKGERIHFASAMTLLGYNDGESEGVSYLALAEYIMQHGANVDGDLEQLWRRIVFNIAVKNTDDHLRNHGFLRTDNGWVLSPAYDINPVYFGKGLTLNISETDNALDFKLALSVAKFFRLTDSQANLIIDQVKKVVNTWKEVATKQGISNSLQDQMSAAFDWA